MKHVLTGCAGCSLFLLLLSGCGPELAQTQLGAEEEQWQTQIRASYSSWQPPRSAPPATFDNRSTAYKPTAAPADDAELTVEKNTAPEAAAPDTVGIPSDTPAVPAVEEATVTADTKAEAPEAKQAAAAPAAATEEYVVQKGDNISLIAKKFYGNGRKFMPIIKANEAVLKGNPNRIYPGMKLVIPKN